MKVLRYLVLGSVLALASTSVHAMLIDVTGQGGNLGKSTVFEAFGLTLFVDGWSDSLAGDIRARNIHQSQAGLGVTPGPNGINNNHASFGNPGDQRVSELLSFRLLHGEILGFSLRRLGNGEQAAFGQDGGGSGCMVNCVLTLFDGPATTYMFGAPVQGWAHGAAVQSSFDTNFRISGVYVKVSEPAGVTLVSVLLGIGLLLRRRVLRLL